MPNARPAFMEKVTLTTVPTEDDPPIENDTWRFYPRQPVDTWEILVTANDGTLAYEGVSHEWTGEDWNISNGTKTVIATNKPTSAMLTVQAGAAVIGLAGTGDFAIDLGLYKALQITLSGANKTATIHVKAYDKNTGTSAGSGFITGTAHANPEN